MATLVWKTGPHKGPSSRQVIDCILPECEMWLDVTPPVVDQAAAAGVSQALGAPPAFLAQSAVMQHARKVEVACEKHLVTHTVQEWAPALADAQKRLADLEQLHDGSELTGTAPEGN